MNKNQHKNQDKNHKSNHELKLTKQNLLKICKTLNIKSSKKPQNKLVVNCDKTLNVIKGPKNVQNGTFKTLIQHNDFGDCI